MAASLRFAPGRPLTANFSGKIRDLPGGGKTRVGLKARLSHRMVGDS
jgi:hypothetical protein